MLHLQCGNKTLQIKEGSSLIMGVLNITPDSFSDGGKFYKEIDAKKQVEKLINDGADIIDIGGESSRPGSTPITEKEELKRILPLVKFVYKLNLKNLLISVDTYKTNVLQEIAQYIHIANNIFGLNCPWENNENYAKLVKEYNLGLILMHIKGTPQTMQYNPSYRNVVKELLSFFKNRLKFVQDIGIKAKNIIVDPGIGFGKLYEHNIDIIKNLYRLKILKRPILIGISRKSFIGTMLNIKKPQNRLYGSLGANIACFLNGANILRVHDVKETKETLQTFKALYK